MIDRVPLRICHLGKYYPPAPGGIESHVQTLALGQARRGCDVRVICVNHADRRGRDVIFRRYGATRGQERRERGVRVWRIGRSAAVARLEICPTLPAVMRDLNQRPPELVHLHTPNPTMVLAVSTLLRRDVPLVVTHHSDIVRQRVLRWLHGPFERAVYARAGAILSSSPQYIASSPILRQHESKVHLAPMGVDLSPFLDPSPRALTHAALLRRRYGPVLWLAVGRCVYYKGLEVAIDALRRTPGTLLVIGSGPIRHLLQSRARARGVAERVVWCDYADPHQLAGAYLAATALWFASNARSEAFGLVQVEAMAAGCPVINTDIPGSGVTWVCPDGVSGLTVPMNDAVALASASRRLIHEPHLRRRLAEGAVRRATRLFDQREMTERSLAIYRAVTRRQAMPAPAPVRAWPAMVERVEHARLAPVLGEPVRRD